MKSESTVNDGEETAMITVTPTEQSSEKSSSLGAFLLPPRADNNDVPVIEWWDEIYLSKDNRDMRKKAVITPSFKPGGGGGGGGEKVTSSSSGSSSSSSSSNVDLFAGAGISHVRTHM